jgi:outer membrane protein assembly factor BamB
VQWSQAFTGGYGSPCLKDVAGDGIADVVVGNAGGVVYCMNANTGALNWSVTMMYPKCDAGATAFIHERGTASCLVPVGR